MSDKAAHGVSIRRAVVRQGLQIAPRNGMLHHALGLALTRMKRTGESVGELERATALEPGNVRFVYVYAVALHSAGRVDAAIETLEKALTAHPGDLNVRAALASFKQSRVRPSRRERLSGKGTDTPSYISPTREHDREAGSAGYVLGPWSAACSILE